MAKIIRATDAIPSRSIISTIYSDAGTGKTSLSFTAKNPLLLAFEEGVERSFADGRGTFVQYAKWDEVKKEIQSGEFAAMIRDEQAQTVIIDTAGTLIQNQITEYVKQLGGKLTTKGGSALSMDGWQLASNEFNSLVLAIKAVGVDLICLAHAKGDGRDSKLDIDVQGSARGILTKHSDIIAYISNDGRQRWIEFDGSEDRVGKNPARLRKTAIPTCATTGEYPTFLEAKVIAPTKAAMFGQTEMQRKAADLYKSLSEALLNANQFDEIVALFNKTTTLPTSLQFAFVDGCKKAMKFLYATKILSSIKKASDLTTLAKNLRNETYIPKILQEAVGTEIMNRAKELDFTFSKEKGKFVKADGTEEKEEMPVETPINEETKNEETTQD